ncbi:lipoyl synthase [bacterium]|nr:lipoyl synthase [bacterium]
MIEIHDHPSATKANRPEYERKPRWMKVKHVRNSKSTEVDRLMRDLNLNTVCRSADCPNKQECWGRGTATFMILGNVCTRSCSFCDIATGRPEEIDPEEPRRVAEAAAALDLEYVVVTSVNRDERADGGAYHFAKTISEIRKARPGTRVELLTPDFKGSLTALKIVADAAPDVFNHNIETVPRLFHSIQPQGKYERSLEILYAASQMGMVTKSGIILGMGEEEYEIEEVLNDLRESDVDILTMGQYVRPASSKMKVDRWVTPDEFAMWKVKALSMGFERAECGPLVRSSYHADSIVPDIARIQQRKRREYSI